MNRKTFLRIVIFMTCLAGSVQCAIPAFCAGPVRIGVLSFRPKQTTLAQWQPLTSVLKLAIPEHEFVVQALTYPELNAAVANQQLDFVLTNPGHYVLLKNRSKLSAALATLADNEKNQRLSLFGGVIFTRITMNNINELVDIPGKTIAVPDMASLGGYQMQAYELSQLGIHLPKDAPLVITGMPHDKVVETVLAGHADVGFIRSGVLEEIEREGKYDITQIKIINKKNIPGFPEHVSTQLYPEWAFAAMSHIDLKLARHVAAALFTLENDQNATKAMGIHGFDVPADYTPVEELLRALRLPPFEDAPSFTMADVWKRFHWQLVCGLLLTGIIILMGLKLLLTNHRLVVSNKDLFAKKQALRESENYYRSLYEMLDGFAYCKMHYDNEDRPCNFTYLTVNSAFEKLTGLTNVEGRTITELVPGICDSDQLLFNIYGRVAKTGQPEYFELFIEALQKWFQISVYSPRTGYFVALFNVIDDRKKMELKLINSEQQYRLLAENMDDVVWSLNVTTNRFTYVSPSVQKLRGFTSEEVLAQPVEASLTPESYEKAQQWMKVAIKTMQKGSINRLANLHEVEQPCRDGSTVWTETSVVYLMDDHNQLFEIIGVSRDIGERKRLNDEIHKALVSEKDSNRTMNRLMRVVAHEFRTPLSLLSSSIDLIDHYWERLSIKQRREQIGNTRSSLHQMSSLINSIVSFINLDHQNSEHKPTLLDIERTCNTLAAEVGIVWGTEHDFHITISPDCGAVFMQEVPFRRVLSNLLTNAFRYTPSGGTISLHVSRSDKRLLIILEDTGIGMSAVP